MNKTFLLFIAFCFLLISCDKDDEPQKYIDPKDSTAEFIYSAMQKVYLWNDRIPEIYPNAYSDMDALFNEICYREVDKWSFVTDDFNATLDMFKGISTSYGYFLSLGRYSNSNDLFAVVLYVYENTPAAEAGLKRGDIIVKVDGDIPNISNYKILLNKTSCTLTLGELNNDVIGDSGVTKAIVQREIDEFPIIHKEVFEGTNTAYLMYNSFINRFDDDLKQVFAEFKSQGVDELILDLRYNGGGDDVSATLLASLIAPKTAATEGKYFFKSVYNDYYTAFYEQNPDKAEARKAWGMKFEEHDECLDLDRVFILTTDGTASASELVINGLIPVMEVCVVGDTTHGKCTGMTGFGDDPKSPENSQWGIFPVIVKASNSAGVTDYYDGLIPDVLADDDFPFLPFGDKEDPLVKEALAKINGVEPSAPSALKTQKIKFRKVGVVGDKPDICKNLLLLKK